MKGVKIIARVARKDLNSQFIHVMVQGVNKEYIFKNRDYVESYLNIINENKIKFELTIIAYCVMSNHAYFLIYTKDIEQLGKFMHKVNLLYSNLYNQRENRCGVIFRNRYRAEPIKDMKYLINCIKYIHDNPVKAGMVPKCEDYKYSSYKDYINNEGVTQTEIMKTMFGEKCNYSLQFKSAYEKKFMDIEDENKNYEEYIARRNKRI